MSSELVEGEALMLQSQLIPHPYPAPLARVQIQQLELHSLRPVLLEQKGQFG